MNALISVLLLLTVLWEMDESPQQKPETWKKKNNDEKEGNERQFEADSVISRSDQRCCAEAAQLLLVRASETAEWHVRAGPPEDTRQLLLVAGTSGRPTENLSRSPLGDGRAGGIIVIFGEKFGGNLI